MHVITGGAGFLGSALLWELNRRGIEDILIVDNLAKTEKWRNLLNGSYFDYLHKDVFLDNIKNGKFSHELSSIIHLGACSSTTQNDADYLMENNFHYSQTLCRFALEHGARFINASSAATYGNGKLGFNDDPCQLDRLRPLNMYGYSKHLFDLWLKRKGLLNEVASLKFFNVYGPNEYHKGTMASVAYKFCGQIQKDGYAGLFASGRADIPDGEQRRDFVYVKDCVALISWLLLDKPSVNGIRNVGSGVAASFLDVAKSLFAALGQPVDIRYLAMPAGLASNYQYYTCADMSWLRREECPVAFRDVGAGVKDYVENYLKMGKRYLNPADGV